MKKQVSHTELFSQALIPLKSDLHLVASTAGSHRRRISICLIRTKKTNSFTIGVAFYGTRPDPTRSIYKDLELPQAALESERDNIANWLIEQFSLGMRVEQLDSMVVDIAKYLTTNK